MYQKFKYVPDFTVAIVFWSASIFRTHKQYILKISSEKFTEPNIGFPALV